MFKLDCCNVLKSQPGHVQGIRLSKPVSITPRKNILGGDLLLFLVMGAQMTLHIRLAVDDLRAYRAVYCGLNSMNKSSVRTIRIKDILISGDLP